MSGNDTNGGFSGEWWYGWQGDDLIIEVALDARGAAAELSRLRAEYERLRALLDPDNEGAVDVVARVLMNRNGLRFGAHVAADDPIHESYRNDARAVLSTLRKEAE